MSREVPPRNPQIKEIVPLGDLSGRISTFIEAKKVLKFSGPTADKYGGPFLGRKARFELLPKISAAVASLIAPIASSTTQSKDRERQNGDFKRAKIIPLRPTEAPAPVANVQAKVALPAQASVASAFLQLFDGLHERRQKLLNWLGRKAYREAGEKKSSQFSKGAMLDETAE